MIYTYKGFFYHNMRIMKFNRTTIFSSSGLTTNANMELPTRTEPREAVPTYSLNKLLYFECKK